MAVKKAFTICAINYLSKALVLAESFRRFHPDDEFTIFLIGRKRELEVSNRPGSIRISWIEDLEIPNLKYLAFRYDVIEFSTCIKPWLLAKVLRDCDAALYIDPDIKIYAPLDGVYSILRNASIILTPHSLTPIEDGKKPGDIEFLRFGAYNLGFIGVKNCSEGNRFLEWWGDRCTKFGFYEPQLGLAVDQKWIDLVPSYFEDVKIVRDLGLNVAFWNLHERTLSLHESGWKVNGEVELKFIHFSSFDPLQPERIAGKQDRFASGERSDFTQVAIGYAADLERLDTGLNSTPYCYDFFVDGAAISPTLRRFYSIIDSLDQFEDPFEVDSRARAFGERSGLMARGPASRTNFKDLGFFQRYNRLFIAVLKTVLRVVGPDRYFSLMRYLAYISSIRNQRGMFK